MTIFLKSTSDVPGMAIQLRNPKCGKLFCSLGCVCDSLKNGKNRSTFSMKHCSRPECMLKCICGYPHVKPSSRSGLSSLLKGNESFENFGKIDFSASGRRCREKRVPERFSDYEMESRVSPRPASKDSNKKGPRGTRSLSSRPSRPSKNSSPPTIPATQQNDDSVEKKTTSQSLPNDEASTKITSPCKKRKIPNKKLTKASKMKVVKITEEAMQIPSPGTKLVANTSSIVSQLLQDKRFDFPKLLKEEQARAFDDEVDLKVVEVLTVQLVSWIRFQRIYQSGGFHIRSLIRRASHVILVMHPNEIVAVNISRDIQTMQGDENAPEIVKKLLDPYIVPEESSQYAVLLCDGVKWELVGFSTLNDQEKSIPPPVPEEIEKDEQSCGNCASSSHQDMVVVASLSSKTSVDEEVVNVSGEEETASGLSQHNLDQRQLWPFIDEVNETNFVQLDSCNNKFSISETKSNSRKSFSKSR